MIEVGKANNNVMASYVFVVSYLVLMVGLLLLNALQVLEVVPVFYANYMRAGLHLVPFIVFAYFFSFYKLTVIKKDVSLTRIGIAFLMMFFVLLSVLSNNKEFDVVGRMLITFLHLCNLTIILPFSMRFIDVNLSLRLMAKFFCWCLFFICSLVLYNYLYGEFVWIRVGYPYIPGVYAYMCLVGFIVSVGFLRFDMLGGFFLINVFLSGSRSALALAVVFYLAICFIDKLGIKRIAVLGVSCCVFLVGFTYMLEISRPNVEISRPNVEIYRPYIVERKDLTSGRMALWREAIDVIKEAPLLGYSNKLVFGVGKYGEGIAVHNSFLDLSVQYGLFYAILAYLYWFSFALDFLKQKFYSMKLAWSLFFVVTAKSLITNTFWTNMGDGVTYFIFVLVMLVAIGIKVELGNYE